jgi:predicted phage terminase large subunit-like protein
VAEPARIYARREWWEAELYSRSLSRFIAAAWHVVEPTTPFVPNWHLEAIAEHLEAVTRGEIRNLLINIPPRCMKSLSVAVFWFAWCWARNPESRWLFSSYALSLSIRDNLKCRRLIESPWFRDRWGDRFTLTSDQNAKQRFENDKSGVRLATSVDGMATGEGGDVVVVDDPHHVGQAESDAHRESTLIWWDEVMSTRLNDPDLGAKVVVMQRVHDRDLSGHVLEQGGYEHLLLPMEYEPDRHCSTSIGWSDPRKADGELLWPERFTTGVVDDLRRRLGEYGYAGQMQQRPAPRGGGMFPEDGFSVVDDIPSETSVVRACRSWDKAATEGGGAYSAGVLMAKLDDGRFVVLDVARGQWSSSKREMRIKSTARLDGKDIKIKVEQEPGSGGKESAENTIRNLAGFHVEAERPTGDKEARARPYAIQVQNGNVLLLRGEWNAEFIREHAGFPMGTYKDQVDAASMAFNDLALGVEGEAW